MKAYTYTRVPETATFVNSPKGLPLQPSRCIYFPEHGVATMDHGKKGEFRLYIPNSPAIQKLTVPDYLIDEGKQLESMLSDGDQPPLRIHMTPCGIVSLLDVVEFEASLDDFAKLLIADQKRKTANSECYGAFTDLLIRVDPLKDGPKLAKK